MKHAISRFFRFFLVAALVAALAGSLMPTKVVGQATPTTTVTPSGLSILTAAISWTIVAQNHATALTAPLADDPATDNTDADSAQPVDGADIVVTFPGTTTVPTTISPMNVMVNNVMPFAYDDPDTDDTDESERDDIVSVSGQVVTIESPVAVAAGGRVEIKFTAAAGLVHATAAAGAVTVALAGGTGTPSADYTTDSDPTVVPTSSNAGAVTQWRITFTNGAAAVTADNSEITLAFSSATVPSAIAKTDIALQPTRGATTLLKIDPTSGGKSLSFFAPVGVAADAVATIIISARAGIAHGGTPGSATVDATIGGNAKVTSDPYDIKAYLNISPTRGEHGTTVSVTGGGFTAGTAGSVLLGDASVGSYTVDSAGKLTGSFTATKGTGKVSVRDLGRNAELVEGPTFTQVASANPSATDVAQGGSISVMLRDFPTVDADAEMKERLRVSATIGGVTMIDAVTQTGNMYTLNVPQSEPTGTKQVTITGQIEQQTAGADTDTLTDDMWAAVADKAASDSFLITIVSRTLTVMPSSTVPGQAVTVTGSGFERINAVNLSLGGASVATNIQVNTDGTFLYTGKVPFNNDTVSPGAKQWKAVDAGNPDGRAATSAGFTIQKRAITLSPSSANPGSTVEVYGSGFGVTTRGTVNSQVSVDLWVNSTTPLSNAVYGPFPVSSSGEFTGTFQVPTSVGVSTIIVRAIDNNGGADDPGTDVTESPTSVQTGQFYAGSNNGNQHATKNLRVPTGVISVSPAMASTGSVITVTGSGFPAQTNLAELMFGDANALPVPAPATDVNGNFTVTLTVPAAPRGGSLEPGAVIIRAKVQSIEGTTSFTIPGPTITLSAAEARPGDTIGISGSGFSAYSNVGTINVGQQNQAPTPNPLTDGVGSFTAEVLIPALNPGAYTITVRTSSAFTATAPVRILSSTVGNVVPAEQAFQALTSRGLLTLAAAASPGGTMFGAFVPGLAGNTLVNVEPNGVLILTLNADARVSVSGQPAVSVTADTPTFFALGSTVSIEVVE